VGEKPVDHGLRDQANAAFRSPETLSVEFRVFTHDHPRPSPRCFNIDGGQPVPSETRRFGCSTLRREKLGCGFGEPWIIFVSWTGAGWVRIHHMGEAEKRFKAMGLL
jgi:hypothetical protein